MKSKSLILTAGLAGAMTILPALSLAATNSVAPERSGTATLELLGELRAEATAARIDADNLEIDARGADPSWQANSAILETMKDDVNGLAGKLARLENLRDSAIPPEQAEIDRTAGIVKQMADDTKAAIRFVSDREDQLWVPDYRTHVSSLVNESSQLSKSLDEFIRLAKASA
jgi:hypothetical protein